jgi:ATP-dependent RNA helicase RhlE
VSLVCVDEHKLLRDIERLLKRQLEKRIVPGFEPDPNAKAQPIENGRRTQGQGGRDFGGGRDARPPRQGQGEARKPQGDNRARGEGRSNAARNAAPHGGKPQPNGGGARRSGPPRQGASGAGRSEGQRDGQRSGGFRQR